MNVYLAWPVSKSTVAPPESAPAWRTVTFGCGLVAGDVAERVVYEVYWRVAGLYQARTKFVVMAPGVVLPRRSTGWSKLSVKL